MYQKVTLNFNGARTRYEMLENKQYLVVPAVILTEGVHKGDQGALYYSKPELAKNPIACNHKPVVIYHPSMNGEGISACDPVVVEKQRVGLLFNTAYDGRWKTETWLDEEKLKKVDERVLKAIQNGESVEVSTGLFHDSDGKPGKWNGEDYLYSATNLVLDHLAILPDQKGACSIADGAGLLVNAEMKDAGLSLEDIREQISNLLRDDRKSGVSKYCEDYCYVCDLYSKFAVYTSGSKHFKIGYKVKSGKVSIDGEPEEVRKVTSYVTANGEQSNTQGYVTMSGKLVMNEDMQGPLKTFPREAEVGTDKVMLRQQLTKKLQEKYAGVAQDGDWGGWVTDIFANYAVYSKDGKHFRLPYTYEDDNIRFDGEPEEVEKVTEYKAKAKDKDSKAQQVSSNNQQEPTVATKPTISSAVQNADEEKKKKDSEERTGHIDKMVKDGSAKESDRKYLEGLPDDHFKAVQGFVSKGATQETVPYTREGIGDRSNVHKVMSGNMSTDEWMASAPPEVQRVVRNSIDREKAEKLRLVKIITANKNNPFTEQFLMLKDEPELRGMALLAGNGGQQHPNYSGQGDIPVPMFVDNAQVQNVDTSEEDTLSLPVYNFSN